MNVALIKSAATAGLQLCRLCREGFRRIGGEHIGSQSKGMIENQPCQRVFAACGDVSSQKPWIAYVDGHPLVTQAQYARRFKTAESAYREACKKAPKMWHG